ncbi:MAG: transporter, ATP-binding protein [Herbaspirillum sp.]|jgi:NitT/TauT family transport system ATP-binding protein|nr:transporter, ATP-binding protein [Herbaspirillum sp.]
MSAVQRVVEFKGVAKRFDGDSAELKFAAKDLSLHIDKDELVAVVGKTGCGKSTMFNLLIGLIAPSAGSIEVLGRDPFREFNALAGKLSVVFQSDRLLPWRTAIENVAYGLELRKVPKAERLAIALDWLTRLGLEMHADKWPHSLSGGMRQRVSIARAFATDPEIMLCDEPFSALDELTGAKLRQEFRRLVKETRKTGVFVTHSIREAIEIGDRIMVFRAPGHVAAEFKVGEALRQFGEEGLKQRILEEMGSGSTNLEPLTDGSGNAIARRI